LQVRLATLLRRRPRHWRSTGTNHRGRVRQSGGSICCCVIQIGFQPLSSFRQCHPRCGGVFSNRHWSVCIIYISTQYSIRVGYRYGWMDGWMDGYNRCVKRQQHNMANGIQILRFLVLLAGKTAHRRRACLSRTLQALAARIV
jgi:hypothetical protein